MKAFTDIFTYNDGNPFPTTAAVTSSTSQSFDGTEYNKEFVDEIMGFFQAALNGAGLSPSGSTDTASASQILSGIISQCAMSVLSSGYVCTAANVGGTLGAVTGDIVSNPVAWKIYGNNSFRTLVFEKSYMTIESDTFATEDVIIIGCNQNGTALQTIPAVFVDYMLSACRFETYPSPSRSDVETAIFPQIHYKAAEDYYQIRLLSTEGTRFAFAPIAPGYDHFVKLAGSSICIL